ncbi:Protease 3 precursor [Serratia fonticola]|uniref:Protease 3 n=1 Tax=Serratia fonticola TaxID=47917 RepID=A0A4U9V127_SERFO|nr:Protease 3 precursor [Serratia fonticola]
MKKRAASVAIFDRGNFAFDTREKLIAQVQTLTPAKLADYFHQAVIKPQGLALLSQVSGSSQQKADFAAPGEGWVTYPNGLITAKNAAS